MRDTGRRWWDERVPFVQALGRFTGALIVSAILSTSPVFACGFDLTKPERSLIDWIVEADALVIARPQPGNAFRYAPEEMLLGAEHQVQLPHLVPSVYRRKLAANADEGVLFAKVATAEDNAARTEWKQIAYVDDGTRSLIEIVVSHRDAWAVGYPETRKSFVESLQTIDNPTVEAVVINEFDKMPYEMLRGVDIRVPSSELISDLWTLEAYPFQTTRVLMLGLINDHNAQRVVQGYFNRTKDWNRAANLGAFSAALVEMEGAQGVQFLSDRILSQPDVSLDAVEQTVLAFAAVNRLAGPEVRQAIAVAIADSVAARAEVGVIVARQFAAVSDWSQINAIEPLVRDRKVRNITALLTVSSYVAQAREARATAGEELPL